MLKIKTILFDEFEYFTVNIKFDFVFKISNILSKIPYLAELDL